MHLRHKRKSYASLSICSQCGILWKFENGHWVKEHNGENLTYAILAEHYRMKNGEELK